MKMANRFLKQNFLARNCNSGSKCTIPVPMILTPVSMVLPDNSNIKWGLACESQKISPRFQNVENVVVCTRGRLRPFRLTLEEECFPSLPSLVQTNPHQHSTYTKLRERSCEQGINHQKYFNFHLSKESENVSLSASKFSSSKVSKKIKWAFLFRPENLQFSWGSRHGYHRDIDSLAVRKHG